MNALTYIGGQAAPFLHAPLVSVEAMPNYSRLRKNNGGPNGNPQSKEGPIKSASVGHERPTERQRTGHPLGNFSPADDSDTAPREPARGATASAVEISQVAESI